MHVKADTVNIGNVSASAVRCFGRNGRTLEALRTSLPGMHSDKQQVLALSREEEEHTHPYSHIPTYTPCEHTV